MNNSAVAGSSESTCDQLGCSPTEWSAWIIEKLHCNIYYSNRNSAEIKYNTICYHYTDERKPAQTKSPFIPDKCRLARQLTDERTPPTHPISENSSANDWFSGLLLRQNRLSFPTTADETTPYPHPHIRKLLGKWLFSQFRAILIFFRVLIKFYFFLGGGPCPSGPAVSYAYAGRKLSLFLPF